MPVVGINHVALEVGSIDEALAFYGRFFELHLRGVVPGMAFIDMGDQFLALSEGRDQDPTTGATSGSWSTTRRGYGPRSPRPDVEVLPGRRLDFLDPWGNRIEIVDYRDIQFTKDQRVLDGMGLDLTKRQGALDELREKGLA